MADVFSKRKRSQVMARVRSRGNRATELALAKLFRRHQITGWRRQVQIRGRAALLRGPNSGAARRRRPANFRVRPDFVFPQRRLAVFVDGCFWHGCPWHGTQPKNNRAFWRRKFARNKRRDARVNRELRRLGWRGLRIWEHALRQAEKSRQQEARLLRRLAAALGG